MPRHPQPLITATIDLRNHDIDDALHAERVNARTAYQLKPKDPPDVDGYYRMSCPALGNRLGCPLRPDSQIDDGRITVLDPPDPAPAVCTQTAITIAPDAGARHRQPLPHATETWQRRYATLRNTIEGLNGYLKDPAHETLAAPGRRRVRGHAAQAIFTALLLMAANIRKIRAHRAAAADNQTQAIAQRARARRRRTSLRDYQHQRSPPATSPTPAANPALHPADTFTAHTDPDKRAPKHHQQDQIWLGHGPPSALSTHTRSTRAVPAPKSRGRPLGARHSTILSVPTGKFCRQLMVVLTYHNTNRTVLLDGPIMSSRPGRRGCA